MASRWAARVCHPHARLNTVLTSTGMRFSLQTREIIADSIETVTCAQHHDACIAIPGCDKNMPGVIMAFARHNRPSIMVYGGSIMPGYSETLKKPINISTCYEKHGAYIYKNLQSAEEGKFSPDEIMDDIERNACPGAGACGGMYTANTMSTSIEGTHICIWVLEPQANSNKPWVSRFLTHRPRPQRHQPRCVNAPKPPPP
jgi:dihydroxyacid dehydratase/phosphogluconate dehydratase